MSSSTSTSRLLRSSSDTSLSVSQPSSYRRRAALRRTLQASISRLRNRRRRVTNDSTIPTPPAADGNGAGASCNTPAPKLARHHQMLECLEFAADGSCQKRRLTRHQILDIARSHLAPPPPVPPTPRTPPPRRSPSPQPLPSRMPQLFPPHDRGEGKRGARTRPRPNTLGAATLAFASTHSSRRRQAANALTMRDLRQVDPVFSPKPALWVRQNALVVSLERVRALVLFDRMLLFDAATHDNTMVPYVRSFLGSPRSPQDFYMPFEFRALDAILDYVCNFVLLRDYERLEPRIKRTLDGILPRITPGALEELRGDEQKLRAVYARAARLQHAVQELLDEDEDMAAMYLTEKWHTPDRTRTPEQHDEAETLLEIHLQSVDYITTKAELLSSAIDDIEGLIEIHLDVMQNRLLFTDLVITALTTVVSFGSMVASIFGMNFMLPRQMRFLPSSKYYFFGCVAVVTCLMGAAMLFIIWWANRLGKGRNESAQSIDLSSLRRIVTGSGGDGNLVPNKSWRRARRSASSIVGNGAWKLEE